MAVPSKSALEVNKEQLPQSYKFWISACPLSTAFSYTCIFFSTRTFIQGRKTKLTSLNLSCTGYSNFALVTDIALWLVQFTVLIIVSHACSRRLVSLLCTSHGFRLFPMYWQRIFSKFPLNYQLWVSRSVVVFCWDLPVTYQYQSWFAFWFVASLFEQPLN